MHFPAGLQKMIFVSTEASVCGRSGPLLPDVEDTLSDWHQVSWIRAHWSFCQAGSTPSQLKACYWKYNGVSYAWDYQQKTFGVLFFFNSGKNDWNLHVTSVKT